MLRHYGVDGYLLLAIKVISFLLRVCVPVGGVKWQPFTVGIGLRQRCVQYAATTPARSL